MTFAIWRRLYLRKVRTARLGSIFGDLGLAKMAFNLAQTYLPFAQVQLVNPILESGGMSCDRALKGQRLNDEARACLTGYPKLVGRVALLGRRSDAQSPHLEQVAQVVGRFDSEAQKTLELPGHAFLSTAEQLALQLVLLDTHSGLYSVGDREPSPVDPGTIVVIGRESSRPLYEARMACREAGIDLPHQKPLTGQLFVGNPYQASVNAVNLYNES